jgi:hypothetical protein
LWKNELRNNCGKYLHTLIGIPSQGTSSADNFSIDPSLCTVTLDAKYEFTFLLTLNLLTTIIVAPPSNASKWQMEFNSVFKGLMSIFINSLRIVNDLKP